jgi:8-oxo-dGTP pyrophosphatase MutT (NUDIX family)
VHRARLLALLRRYQTRFPDEAAEVARWRAFVEAHADCLERRCEPGHVTGSAWILSPDRRSVLLGRHRKLGRWLQLGGHADGEGDLLAVALREAREESGMADFAPLAAADVPLDLDVHEIPARDAEPAHLHYDVRWLLVAAPGQRLAVSEESTALRWVPRDALAQLVDEESQLRMERKARRLLAEPERDGVYA